MKVSTCDTNMHVSSDFTALDTGNVTDLHDLWEIRNTSLKQHNENKFPGSILIRQLHLANNNCSKKFYRVGLVVMD